MAQYEEYLQYLKHVDDTTLQDFEKEKSKLQDEITATINHSKQEIMSIEEKCKQEIEKQKFACEIKISDINQQFNDKEIALKRMSSEIETCKLNIATLTQKANMYERLYNNSLPKLKSLSLIRSIFIALIMISSFGILLVCYFFYWIFNLNHYFSIIRWIQCDKYATAWVTKL